MKCILHTWSVSSAETVREVSCRNEREREGECFQEVKEQWREHHIHFQHSSEPGGTAAMSCHWNAPVVAQFQKETRWREWIYLDCGPLMQTRFPKRQVILTWVQLYTARVLYYSTCSTVQYTVQVQCWLIIDSDPMHARVDSDPLRITVYIRVHTSPTHSVVNACRLIRNRLHTSNYMEGWVAAFYILPYYF